LSRCLLVLVLGEGFQHFLNPGSCLHRRANIHSRPLASCATLSCLTASASGSGGCSPSLLASASGPGGWPSSAGGSALLASRVAISRTLSTAGCVRERSSRLVSSPRSGASTSPRAAPIRPPIIRPRVNHVLRRKPAISSSPFPGPDLLPVAAGRVQKDAKADPRHSLGPIQNYHYASFSGLRG
jgi:hypothetical protein